MSRRHCTIKQLRTEESPFLPEVVLGGVTVAFDPDGRGRHQATNQYELPEAVGLGAQKRPQRYEVTWRDGPVPAPKAIRVPRHVLERRPEPPSVEELLAAGVSERDAPAAAAFQRYLHSQQVYPYGTKPLPPEGSEAMLKRYLDQAKGKKGAAKAAEPDPDKKGPAEAAADAPPGPPAKKKPSHYERRRDEILALVESAEGGEQIQAIAEGLGIEPSTNKRELANAILAREFPRDHKAG